MVFLCLCCVDLTWKNFFYSMIILDILLNSSIATIGFYSIKFGFNYTMFIASLISTIFTIYAILIFFNYINN